jgi:hypothetical protein
MKEQTDSRWSRLLRFFRGKRETVLSVAELLAWAAAAAAVSRISWAIDTWAVAVLAVPIVCVLATGSLPLARIRRRFEVREVTTDSAPGSGRETSSSAVDEQWRDTRWTRNTLLAILAQTATRHPGASRGEDGSTAVRAVPGAPPG